LQSKITKHPGRCPTMISEWLEEVRARPRSLCVLHTRGLGFTSVGADATNQSALGMRCVILILDLTLLRPHICDPGLGRAACMSTSGRRKITSKISNNITSRITNDRARGRSPTTKHEEDHQGHAQGRSPGTCKSLNKHRHMSSSSNCTNWRETDRVRGGGGVKILVLRSAPPQYWKLVKIGMPFPVMQR
jgi:hypothetical protein